MAKAPVEITLGIDVAKDELVSFHWQSNQSETLNNTPEAIRDWLESLPGRAEIAVEPTSSYHLELVQAALSLGHTVYAVNPRQLAHYRESVNLRHKSDLDDARLLARFVDRERDQLRPLMLPDAKARTLWACLKRRALLVRTRQGLVQSFEGLDLRCEALLTEIRKVLARLDRYLLRLIRELGWNDDYRRCLSIPGIGRCNAAALVCAYHRGCFASAHAFIAYLGLDIRRRESGRYKGRQKLTKRGESELRRLLYCAAQPARSHSRFNHYYNAQLDKGMPKTAAKVALARKLARIAFSLINNQQSFRMA